MVAVQWIVSTALLLGGACVSALGTNYEHDGVTTYCWAIPRRTNETKLTEADRTTAYAGTSNCPMEMKLLLPNGTLRTFDSVAVQWTVVANFANGNAINNTQLYYGRDSTGKLAQIVHSNIHSCVYGTGCDPFNDGKELVDKTGNKVANFSDNQATFTDSLQFFEAGEYSVLAHIILPNFNVSSRFDYAVYTKVTVLEATSTPAAAAPTTAPAMTTAAPISTSSSGGLSSSATIGIIVGVVVVVLALIVAFVVMRRRKNNNGTYVPAPVYDGHDAGAKNHGITMTNSTTGFESAWGGPPDRHTNMSLDNTNQSSASSNNQYAAPSYSGSDLRPSDAPFSHAMQQQQQQDAVSYFAGSQGSAAPGGRKKRIDSDVEL